VPYHVRDRVMDAINEEVAPHSDVSKEYHWANKRQRQLDDEASSSGGPSEVHDTYDKLQRNVEKLRELADLKTGPVVWDQRERPPLTPEEQERLRQRRQAERKPPADASVTSLHVGGVPPTLGRSELLPYFLAYGEVRELTVDANRLAAIVTFRQRADAEAACASLYGNLTVRGTRLRVGWARRKASGVGGAGGNGVGGVALTSAHDHYGTGSAVVPPPPRPPPCGAKRTLSSVAASTASATASAGASASSRPPVPRLPPGIRRPAPAGSAVYPAMNPDAEGTRPETG
jgi:hypothetical protein